MVAGSLLEKLRGMSAVDCDTLDVEVSRKLGPFVDCTSNQAIAFFELSKIGSDGLLVHEKLMKESLRDAHWMLAQQASATVEELAVEFMMVRLALAIEPDLSGYSHIQTNPRWSYNKQKTVQNADRIVSIFKHVAPSYDTRRVCIKIPATWEGLQACHELEKRGIATLATTMFCMEQAALAAELGCTYIAPYVNELKVHFEKGYIDSNKAFAFCALAQRYYHNTNSRTRVLPASLTSVDEVMMLAGVDHITISPVLLAELDATHAAGYKGEIGSVLNAAGKAEVASRKRYEPILHDEGAWRLAFSRSERGKSEGKIVQAINIFCEMQEALEAMVKTMDALGGT